MNTTDELADFHEEWRKAGSAGISGLILQVILAVALLKFDLLLISAMSVVLVSHSAHGTCIFSVLKGCDKYTVISFL